MQYIESKLEVTIDSVKQPTLSKAAFSQLSAHLKRIPTEQIFDNPRSDTRRQLLILRFTRFGAFLLMFSKPPSLICKGIQKSMVLGDHFHPLQHNPIHSSLCKIQSNSSKFESNTIELYQNSMESNDNKDK